ncbi:MAG: protein kinase [Terriglobia bacterium]
MEDVHKADSSAPAAVADLSGTTVGRFAIQARLGGGMGEVYRAEDTKLKRTVALKRLAPRYRDDQQFRRRFLQEGQRASALNSERVARVYDVLEEGGEPFLVMEYVEGETLRQRLDRPMSVEEFLSVAVQCVEALVDAHAKDLVHRDLKPENIMLTPAGRVKLLDFGVAKLLPSRQAAETTSDFLSTLPGTLIGTPVYMSPEALLGRVVDERTDIFSLGVVFYEALAGRHPFRGQTPVATDDRILHEDPPPVSQFNPAASPQLDRILAKMLAKDPAQRYATARELLVELLPLERDPAHQQRERYEALPWPRWLRTAALVMILVALLAAASPTLRNLAESWLWPLPDKMNLVVLPFEPIGAGSEEQEYARGLTQTLTAKLTTLTDTHNLQVTPASDIHQRGVTSVEQARQEFGANLVVQGSLHRAQGTVRINCNLVNTRSRSNLRSRTLTESASDVFALEDRVVNAVVDMLTVEVEPVERTVLAAHGTQEGEAHDFYLRGQGYLLEFDKLENVQSAIQLFNQALTIDPNYALAHASLGQAYWRLYESTEESKWVGSARQACSHAVTLRPGLAAARVCLGTLYNGTGRYQEAEAEFRAAVDAEPTHDAAYRGLALAQRRQGKLEQAEQTYRRAIGERSHYWAGYDWLGSFYARELSRFADAASMYEEARRLAPDNVRVHRNLGGAYLMMGRYQDALTAFREALRIRPTAAAYSNLGVTYFHLRQFGKAAEEFEKAVQLAAKNYIVWGNLARAYYWAPGMREKAHAAYQQAVALAREHLGVNPNDADAHILLAYYHAMLGERRESLRYLRQALGVKPNDAEFYFWAAVIHNHFGERSRALERIEQAWAGGHSKAEIQTAVELDSLRDDARLKALLATL